MCLSLSSKHQHSRNNYNSLFIPGPKSSLFCSRQNICTRCVTWKFIMTVGKNIRISPGIIYTGSEIIQLSLAPKNLFIFIFSVSKVFIKLCVTDPAVERIQVTDWFHKLKVSDLNISERTNNKPFFFNNKSIEKHYTQLILIIYHWKVLFHPGFLTAVYRISTL